MIIYSAMFGGYDKLDPIINNLRFKNFFLSQMMINLKELSKTSDLSSKKIK